MRRAALALTRRATQHISADALRELCAAEEADASIDEQLLAVLIDVLDEHVDDNDAMHSALQIVSDVLAADAHLWREHIVRTGGRSTRRAKLMPIPRSSSAYRAPRALRTRA